MFCVTWVLLVAALGAQCRKFFLQGAQGLLEWHRADDRPAPEERNPVLARCQADVGFPRLTRTVDFAAHDGDHDVIIDAGQEPDDRRHAVPRDLRR